MLLCSNLENPHLYPSRRMANIPHALVNTVISCNHMPRLLD